MTILFSIRVSEMPPFTVWYKRKTTISLAMTRNLSAWGCLSGGGIQNQRYQTLPLQHRVRTTGELLLIKENLSNTYFLMTGPGRSCDSQCGSFVLSCRTVRARVRRLRFIHNIQSKFNTGKPGTHVLCFRHISHFSEKNWDLGFFPLFNSAHLSITLFSYLCCLIVLPL